MTRKGQAGVLIFLICCILLVVAIIYLGKIELQHGTSQDFVYGYDAGILWNHAYLTNDHNTAYCFDDERFMAIFDQAQKENKKVTVTYSKYVLKGFFCSSAQQYENVIVTNVELVK